MEKVNCKREIKIKINNKIKEANNIELSDEDIIKLKQILFNNKMHLCPSCQARVCLADRRKLTGPILEGFSSIDSDLITKCANYRKK